MAPSYAVLALRTAEQLDREDLATLAADVETLRDAFRGDESTIELRECLLRMRCAAVHLELLRLQDASEGVPSFVFSARFASALDVAAFVRDLVGRINASLLRERANREFLDESTWSAIYEIALANAEWAFGMIGRDPDLAQFLARGGRSDTERLRASCQMIALLLGATSSQELGASPDRSPRKR